MKGTSGAAGAARQLRRKIGESVRRARGAAGLTQADLAEAAGLETETVSRIERGAFGPSLPTLVAISKALRLDVSRFIGETSQEGAPAPSSPVVRRIAARAALLPPSAQRTLLAVAELIPPPRRGRRSARRP